MPMSNLERQLRFSNLALEEYQVLKDHYNEKLLSLLESDTSFQSLLEATKSHVKPKKQLEKEAIKLSKSDDKQVSDFGNAVLNFLISPTKGITGLLAAISVIITVGGAVLATCISLIIAILIFAITVVPFAALSAALIKTNKGLQSVLNNTKDKNVKKYKKTTENIINQEGGVKDIMVLDSVIRVGEALDDLKAHPELIPVGEATNIYILLTLTESKMEDCCKCEDDDDDEDEEDDEEKDDDIDDNDEEDDIVTEKCSASFMAKEMNREGLRAAGYGMVLGAVGGSVAANQPKFSFNEKTELKRISNTRNMDDIKYLQDDTNKVYKNICTADKLIKQYQSHPVGDKYLIGDNMKQRSQTLSKYSIKSVEYDIVMHMDTDSWREKVIDSKKFYETTWKKALNDQIKIIKSGAYEKKSVKESTMYTKSDLLSMRLDVLEHLAPEHLTYFKEGSVLESAQFDTMDDTNLFMTLESINSKPMLSTSGLLQGIIAIVTETCSRDSILEFLNTYKRTAEYELTNEGYEDFPLLKATGICLEYARINCLDVPGVLESCDQLDQLLGEIITEAEEACAEETGFNPNPFGLGSLTPFPVASRTVGDVLCDICEAETDEEITEAMLSFGRISNIINESYYVNTSEDGSEMIIEASIGKAARKAETKTNEKVSKLATRDKTKGPIAAAKHAIDPMEKFVNTQYKKLKQMDANERRNVIMKGGTIPKVTRWLKRSIPIVALGAAGTVVPVAAVLSAITFIGFIASDKYLDRKERNKIMRELEDEIQICNEKIEDSRGDDNKQKKYELMRIRNSLERQRDRIHFNLSE